MGQTNTCSVSFNFGTNSQNGNYEYRDRKHLHQCVMAITSGPISKVKIKIKILKHHTYHISIV